MPFLTPKELPIDTFCRQLRIPNHYEWVGTVTGALRGACFPSEWEQSDGGITPEAAAARWKQMYYEYLRSTCEGTYNNCRQFPANSPIITYAPNDPFVTPDYVPPGYALPPFYTNPAVPLPGVKPNDAMVNLLSMAVVPTVIFTEGLPRFSLNVYGTGEMELELVKIPQAGYLLIYAPDSETPIQLADMTSVSVTDTASLAFILSLFGLPGDYSVVDTEVIELEFKTAGEHEVICTFVPSIGGEEILGFGGGLRSVTLCGLSVAGESGEYVEFRLNPSNHCQTQVRYAPDGEWETIIDNSDCGCGSSAGETRLNTTNYHWEVNNGSGWIDDPNDPRNNPIVYPPNAGTTDKCQASKNAFNQIAELAAAIWTAMEAGLTLIQIATSIAAILIVLVTRPGDAYWLIPIILQFIAEIKDYELVAFMSQFTAVYAEPLRESLYCHIKDNLTYDDAGVQAVIGDMDAVDFSLGGVNLALPTIKLILYCLGAGGLTNAATLPTSPVTSGECDDFACNANCWEFDFAADEFPGYPTASGYGVHVPGEGWQAPYFSGYDQLDAAMQFSWVTEYPITKVEFDYYAEVALCRASYIGELDVGENTAVVELDGSGITHFPGGAFMEWVNDAHNITSSTKLYIRKLRIYSTEPMSFEIGEPC